MYTEEIYKFKPNNFYSFDITVFHDRENVLLKVYYKKTIIYERYVCSKEYAVKSAFKFIKRHNNFALKAFRKYKLINIENV